MVVFPAIKPEGTYPGLNEYIADGVPTMKKPYKSMT